MKLRGIRKRWFVNSLGVAFLVIVICVLAFSVFTASSHYQSIQSSLESKAAASSEFFTSYVTNTKSEYYQSIYKYTESFDERDTLELQFVDTSGKVVISTYGITAGTSPGTPDIEQALQSKGVSSWRGKSAETGERILAVSSPIVYSNGQVVGVMRYVTSLQLVDQKVTFSICTAGGLGLAVIIIMILSNIFFIRSIVDPITQITTVAHRISEGSFGIQLEKKYDDEIGDLTDAINNMSIKINQSEKLKTEFISSVSHELRTPLTAINGWGETLLYDEGLSSDQRRGLEIISSEARRLTKLVEELLEFTRMEDGRFTLNVREIRIADVLEDSIATYGELLKHDGLNLEYIPPDDEIPKMAGDPERLKQVFFNLLDNASKHGGDGGKIEVSLDADEEYAVIKVRDYGPGIPEDEIDNVKMKFYKGSNSKARGSGIGLAVCDEIIKYHDGILEIKNADSTGLIVTVKLPLMPG